MTEPVSTIGGLVAFLKAFGMTIIITLCVTLVAAVVFMTRMPRSPQEWAIGLICTIVSSLAGGSFIIVKLGLHEWVTDIWGMIALGGCFFICGLPGWAIVRWTTTFIAQREGQNILDIAREIRDMKNGKDAQE